MTATPHRIAVGLLAVAALLAVFALPFLVVFKISVSESDGVRFVDLLTWSEGVLQLKVRLGNYLYILFEDSLYLEAYLSSLKYAALTTAICLFIGYPFAYFLARSAPEVRPGLLMLVMLPFSSRYLRGMLMIPDRCSQRLLGEIGLVMISCAPSFAASITWIG